MVGAAYRRSEVRGETGLMGRDDIRKRGARYASLAVATLTTTALLYIVYFALPRL